MATNLHTFGMQGEQQVARSLEQQGYTICAFNYRTRAGEVDIIARHGSVLAFIEVKTRRQASQTIAELVNNTKQKRIIKAALDYIQKHVPREQLVYRFDVALVCDQTMTYIPNAFSASHGQYV